MKLTKIYMFDIFIILFLIVNTAKATCNKMPDDQIHASLGGGLRMITLPTSDVARLSLVSRQFLNEDPALGLDVYYPSEYRDYFYFMQLYECEPVRHFQYLVIIWSVSTKKCLSYTPALDVELVSCSIPDEIKILPELQGLETVFHYIIDYGQTFAFKAIRNANDPDVWLGYVWLGYEGRTPFAIKLFPWETEWALSPWES